MASLLVAILTDIGGSLSDHINIVVLPLVTT